MDHQENEYRRQVLKKLDNIIYILVFILIGICVIGRGVVVQYGLAKLWGS